uniref:Dehydrogenase/reductase SDR family member 12 n=1 Tax=Helicotheca tamesis TaxID=374047 RepID=A0A7S2E365_9STRA|mmetsp:Transcript_11930/g.16490  ORF Transcript_11930/g.16490 Transcript_11930/m.16490 type:complete len:391 (+) Transcript_11930:53-1225(+)
MNIHNLIHLLILISTTTTASSFASEQPPPITNNRKTKASFLPSKLSSKMGQGISATQFFVYGRKHFTKTGYKKHVSGYTTPVQESASICRGETGADGVDLAGKVVVVTGANSGLGKEIATYAAAKGATLYMLCRSKGRAETARAEIVEKTLNENVNILLADIGELSQLREVVKDLQSKEEKVDCLVCNAGVLLNDRQETSEGNEITFAVHLLGGSYLLPTLLLPQLKSAGPESRVLFVTSGGMYRQPFPSWPVATSDQNAEKKIKYDGVNAYCYAKRAQVLLAERWAKERPEVTWVSGHPGWAATAAVDDAFGSDKKYLEPLRSTWEGAEGLTWLMSTEAKNLQSGEFYLDRKSQTKHLAGAFMTQGSYTKNTEKEVDEMIENLKKACGL